MKGQSKSWKIWGAGAAAVAVCVAGVALWSHDLRRERSTSSSSGAPSRHDSHAGSAGATRSGPLFAQGMEQQYQLDESTIITTSNGQPITQLDLHGPMKLTGLDASLKTVVRGEFKGVVTAGTGADSKIGGADVLSEAAHRPFVLEYDSEGRFVSAKGEVQVPVFVARVWIALGQYLQFVRADAKGDQWEEHESDAAGKYLAAYLKKGPGTIFKRKVMYESFAAKALASYDIKSSAATFALDSDESLVTFDLSEETSANPGGGPLPAFEGATHLKLARTARVAVTDRLKDYLAAAATATPLSDRQPQEDESVRNKARIAGFTLGKVYDDLKAFANDKATSDQRDRAGRAFVALTAMLREDPAVFESVKKRIKHNGPQLETMLAALRDAGTPAAQTLLAELAGPKSPLDGEERMEAARSLSRVEQPSLETVHALKDLRSDPDLGQQATYGLGSALHRLQGRDPSLANEVRSTLTDQLTTATTPDEQAVVLTALGNAGDASTLNAIRGYLASASEEVRAAAAQALRRIAGAEADQLLAATCTDPSANVRYSVVDAIRERPSANVLAAALEALAVREPEFQVRARAVNTLAQWAPEIGGIADVLRVVAQSDPNADLRNVAQRALATGG